MSYYKQSNHGQLALLYYIILYKERGGIIRIILDHEQICYENEISHQVFALFTRAMFMVSGRLVAEGTQPELLEQFSQLG